MHYAIYDKESNLFYLEQALFEQHEKTILTFIPYFTIEQGKDGHILLQTTKKLPNKKPLLTYNNGPAKEELSCLFCRDRLKCLTANLDCYGYVPAERTLVEEKQLHALCKELNIHIIYAKVVS